jgi:hypothetical protein
MRLTCDKTAEGLARTQRKRKLCSGARNRCSSAARISCVFVAYFCCYNGNARLAGAAVVTAAVGHVKDLASGSYAPLRRSRLLLWYSRFVTAGSCEHLPNCQARERSGSDWNNRSIRELPIGIPLCGSDWNDFGLFEHARS